MSKLLPHPRRTDGNQTIIVKALRKAGASVLILSSLGHGCPDLAVGYDYGRGDMRTWLFEVKEPGEGLTPDEMKFFRTWHGRVDIVYGPNEAIEIVRGAIE
jgi:hypothetical protein